MLANSPQSAECMAQSDLTASFSNESSDAPISLDRESLVVQQSDRYPTHGFRNRAMRGKLCPMGPFCQEKWEIHSLRNCHDQEHTSDLQYSAC
jgi:hypothetical protein